MPQLLHRKGHLLDVPCCHERLCGARRVPQQIGSLSLERLNDGRGASRVSDDRVGRLVAELDQ